MKKHILFIAEYNNILKDLYISLEDIFDVQMCLPVTEAIMKSINVYVADMVLVNVSGINYTDFQDTAKVLGMNIGQDTPIVIIGTIAECEEFSRQIRLTSFKTKKDTKGQIVLYSIYRPITNQRIIEKIQERMNLTSEEDIQDKKKILMIDDDAMMIRLIAKQLAPKYKVLASTSGSDGLSKMESLKPDAVLLDYEMPGFNGGQILRMAKENDLIKDIPIYILSGRSDKETVTTLLGLRPKGYFLKNGDVGQILKTFDDYFAKGKG